MSLTLLDSLPNKWNGPILVIILIGLAATVCLAYMAGYYDGYHAGAVIYVGGQP